MLIIPDSTRFGGPTPMPEQPDPAQPATQAADLSAAVADLREALVIARNNGRGSRLTLTAVIANFLALVITGIQYRHGWPVAIADVAFALACGVVLGEWYRVHRVRD